MAADLVSAVVMDRQGLVEHLTDLGNAKRLVRMYGRRLRYVPDWGIWLIWEGRRWMNDRTGHVVRMAKDVVRRMHDDARDMEDREDARKLSGHAFRSERAARINAMIMLAQSEPGVSVVPEQLDSNEWALNCENGTIDLRTGAIRLHDANDLITKLAPVEYELEAKAPVFNAFLERVMGGNADLIAFLRRAVGYSLTGLTREHVLLFCHGIGANGKSTFLSSILQTVGDYGQQAEPELLVQRRGEAHPTGVAKLRGARFVVASEIDKGRRMAEGLVKQLTGGDRLVARFLYRDFFEFAPTHTLWLAANHRPIVRGTDVAIWRRIRLIPFDVVVPPEERDLELGDKLRGELPGILAWAVRGCLEWQDVGLAPPEKVQAATSDYRSAMDSLGGFVADECILDEQAEAGSSELYSRYQAWSTRTGEKPMSQMKFGESLKERGLESFKHSGTRRVMYRGIGLAAGSERVRNSPLEPAPLALSRGEVAGGPFGAFRESDDEEYERVEREALRA